MNNEHKLTKFVQAAGCAAKMGPGDLKQALCNLNQKNEQILVGFDTSDDAGIFQIDENLALVQTVDFITPVVDDPYIYGQIAAANSLSDIFAMGGEVKTALNIVGFDSTNVSKEALGEILRGGLEKIKECGGSLLGGHTIQTPEMYYGLSVTGIIHPKDVKRNNSAKVGDVQKSIEEKIYGGKCTDISSVFVCLLRNAKIPARETFGIRVGQSKISNACGKADDKGFADITGAQHCRAEFYIDGLGWVPCDPADVAKVKLAEKLTNDSKKLKEVKDYFFGSWEMNWVGFNSARDFILEPKPTQYPLNMLGYPYAEVGEDAKDYYKPKTFVYSYTSQEIV